MQHVFTVQGMTCGHCEHSVTRAIRGVDPAAEVRIDRASGQVQVQTGAEREALVRAIAEEGYGVQQQ